MDPWIIKRPWKRGLTWLFGKPFQAKSKKTPYFDMDHLIIEPFNAFLKWNLVPTTTNNGTRELFIITCCNLELDWRAKVSATISIWLVAKEFACPIKIVHRTQERPKVDLVFSLWFRRETARSFSCIYYRIMDHWRNEQTIDERPPALPPCSDDRSFCPENPWHEVWSQGASAQSVLTF